MNAILASDHKAFAEAACRSLDPVRETRLVHELLIAERDELRRTVERQARVIQSYLIARAAA